MGTALGGNGGVNVQTHLLEGRKREEWVGELRNVARHAVQVL
jgi:hypothetical protein